MSSDEDEGDEEGGAEENNTNADSEQRSVSKKRRCKGGVEMIRRLESFGPVDAEDSQEATVTKTLTELISLVVS